MTSTLNINKISQNSMSRGKSINYISCKTTKSVTNTSKPRENTLTGVTDLVLHFTNAGVFFSSLNYELRTLNLILHLMFDKH